MERDATLDSARLAIAAHLNQALRRRTGRVTDSEWMLRSAEYAREVIRLALEQPEKDDMLHVWARRLQEVMAGGTGAGAVTAVAAVAATAAVSDTPAAVHAPPGPRPEPDRRRYVVGLR